MVSTYAGRRYRAKNWCALVAVVALTILAGCSAAPASPGSPRQSGTKGLVWADNFSQSTSASLSSAKWTMMNRAGGFGNNELEAYTPRNENVSFDGHGSLLLTARAETYTDPTGNVAHFTSGRIETTNTFLYGTIVARIKVPSGKGLWPAFWTIGTETAKAQWPVVGEIDIMELVDEGTTLNANVHANTVSGGQWSSQGTKSSLEPYGSAWHIFSVKWTKTALVFSVDGTEYHTIERAKLQPNEVWAFSQPQHIILNLAVGGDWPQDPTDPSVFPATMLIDYVRVYDSSVG